MIEIEDVSLVYGKVRALRGVSLRCEPGEVVGLLGLNGAGKSSLLKVVTGCLSPTSGKVAVNGLDVATHPEAKGYMGFLPEAPPLYLEMTVAEYLRFVARLKNIPAGKRKAQVTRVMGQVDLTGVSGRLLGNLSKGYRQRVGIAQALLGDPPVLILDEPTVGLDPAQMREMRDLIGRCSSSRRTVLFSSHILSEVLAVSGRVAVLNRGRVAAFGRLDQLGEERPGQARLYLKTEAEREALGGALAALPGVVSLETLPVGAGAPCETYVLCPDDADMRRRIFRAVAANGWTILEMRSVAPPVEETLGRIMVE